MTSDDVLRRVLDKVEAHYSITPDKVRLFDGEVDINLKVEAKDRRHYLIKISPPGTSPPALNWQISILDTLSAYIESGHELGFSVPHLLRSDNDLSIVDVDGYSVRVMTWVDGELMTAIGPASSTLLIDIGRVSAVLTHALKKTRVPTGLPRHKWMAEYGGISLRRALSNLPESFEVDILKEILSFHEKYDSKYQGLPRSTVHQDLNDHNLLVDKRFPDRIAGVIDFNDTVTTIRVADVALAAAYGMLRQPDPVGSFLDVVRGYERSQQLTASERKVIFPISITRLCINWATWRVKELVEGKTVYGSARTRSTWPVIEHIVNLGLNSTQEHVLNSIPSCV